MLREKVKGIEVVGPYGVRFHLSQPWPDFLAYYGSPATGAAWVVPKRYVEQVGDEGFKKHPIGHDQRVRLAVALDKQAINEADRLGMARLTGSIVNRQFAFAPPLEPYPYNLEQAKRWLAEAGYRNGFDAGILTPVDGAVAVGESVSSDLGALGIKIRMRLLERAAFFSA